VKDLLTSVALSDDVTLIKRYLALALEHFGDERALLLLAVDARTEIRHALEKQIEDSP
jgi:hypothetical protein